MAEEKQDVFKRAYEKLSSLQKNISQMTVGITETYVREFHRTLDRLQGIGIDVSEFRIPDSEVQPRVTMSHFASGGAKHSYSKEKYVDKSFILIQLDAILAYLDRITAKKPNKMGYPTPDNQ